MCVGGHVLVSVCECIWVYFCVYLSVFWCRVYVAISWTGATHEFPEVLWVLCFSGWHTYYCEMTMELPQIDQHLFCLETRALENGPDSSTLDPDWSSSGTLLYLAGAITFYSFEMIYLSDMLCLCMCVWVCRSTGIKIDTYTGVLSWAIFNMKMQKMDIVTILVSVWSSGQTEGSEIKYKIKCHTFQQTVAMAISQSGESHKLISIISVKTAGCLHTPGLWCSVLLLCC